MTNLRKIRKANKITQSELGKKLGLTQQCVYRAEKRGVQTIRVAKRYAKVLGCSPLDLMDI